jgi:isopentenyl phosphate kinase
LKKTVNQLSEIIKAKDPSSCHYSFILIHGAGSFVSSPSQLTLIIVLT